MKIGKRMGIFLLVLIIMSLSSVFAAEYEKTTDQLIKILQEATEETIKIKNKTTYDEATNANKKMVDTLDAISSGYTPHMSMKIGLNNERTETVFWELKIEKQDISALDTDERIIQELAVINSKKTFEEKVKEIDRYIRSVCKYDKSYVNGERSEHIASETAMGCLNGKAICQGYSNLASYLYERMGIENIKVRGIDNRTNVRHVWNVVRDKNGKMYVVDTTWNGPTGTYLLMGLDEYAKYCTDEFDESELFDLKYPVEIKINESVQPYRLNAYAVEQSRYYSRIVTILECL